MLSETLEGRAWEAVFIILIIGGNRGPISDTSLLRFGDEIVFTPPRHGGYSPDMETVPVAFIAAAAAMTVGQAIKIFSPVFRGKAPVFRNAFQSGGMPSAHTAACAAMAITAGLREGFCSSLFAVAAVLTAVVAHDAVKVRGSLNTIIRVLRKTASNIEPVNIRQLILK